MGFDAKEAVPALDWDFRPYVEASGTTPEPSNQEIVRYMTRVRSIIEAARRTAMAQIEDETERAKKMTEEELDAVRARWAGVGWKEGVEILEAEIPLDASAQGQEMVRAMAENVEKMSKGSPTADQIMGLPGRIRSQYLGWLTGQLTDPESQAVGTRPSLSLVPGGASGI